MTFNVIMLKNNAFASMLGRNLTNPQACELLEELHDLETCRLGQCVTPVITLRATTNLPSFIVHRKQDVFQFQVEVNYYNELCGIDNFKTQLN